MKLHPTITSPVEVATCTSDIDGSKKQLNRVYQLLTKKLDAASLPAFEKAQNSWLDYRIAECSFETGGNPGSTMYDSGVIACTADMNRKRADKLQKLLDQLQ